MAAKAHSRGINGLRAGRDGRRVRDAVVVAVVAELFEINVADRGDGRDVLRRDLHKTLHAIAPDSPGVGVRGRWRRTPREHRSDLCKVRAVATGFACERRSTGRTTLYRRAPTGRGLESCTTTEVVPAYSHPTPQSTQKATNSLLPAVQGATAIASALFDVNDGDQLACAEIETKATQSFKCGVSACVQPRLNEARQIMARGTCWRNLCLSMFSIEPQTDLYAREDLLLAPTSETNIDAAERSCSRRACAVQTG